MKIDLVDMIGLGIIMILCMFFGYGFGYMSYEENTNRYDVNGDGQVTAADYVAIRNYIMEEE